ncbi:hypothetical protein BDP27DRAFT_1404724 [Rhodocollybia butyracea]|uniref:Uncharacterized protein n=1 Tax=Rhodocollybia butyracea TaxID=206335 RepID=A0A9P5U3H8_9AGAR|nr:hypothetical protein BDP27DRAFT_1404724 [Rhodocollybia butyracea]
MGSHGFTISGGQFTLASNAYYGSENWDSDSTSKVSVSVYPRHKLHTWGVVRTRENWTFNSAVVEKERSGKSMSVFVQTFEGHGAKQLFMSTLEFSRRLVNGHHLNLIGVSPSSNFNTETDVRYIVYERAHSRDTRRLLAASLVKGEKETTTMGLRAVYGIASALAHLFKVASSIPLEQIEVETFTDANYIIWREKIDRLFNADVVWGHKTYGRHDQSQGSAAEVFLQASESDWELSFRPRRELIWTSLGCDMRLSDMSEVYEDFLLDSPFDTSSSLQPLPHRMGMSRISGHKCKGYRREEVTFTPNAFRSVVMVYREPSPNERCVLCGKVVTMDESSSAP